VLAVFGRYMQILILIATDGSRRWRLVAFGSCTCGCSCSPTRRGPAPQAGRHDLHLRHRWDRRGPGTGRSRRREGRRDLGKRKDHTAGPARGSGGRDAVHLVPVLLGGGVRLFDDLGPHQIELRRTRTVEAPSATHLRFAVATRKR
jgi:hypothetical protein